MESDCIISVKGIQEEQAYRIANSINGAIKYLLQLDENLDLRRMHRIIFASDFAGELSELSKKTVSGNLIKHTNEDYAFAFAIVLLLPHKEEFEIVPVFNANIFPVFGVEENEDYNIEQFCLAFHVLHHELCHVHDINKKIDIMPDTMLKHSCSGKNRYTLSLAEACWSEYIAELLSYSTASNNDISIMLSILSDALIRTKPLIDKEILSYRYHHDVDRVMTCFQRHGDFLAISAAHIMGYMDAENKSIIEFSENISKQLAGSCFEPTWNDMHAALKMMLGLYPDKWKNIEIYNELNHVMKNYYKRMGLILTDTKDGVYVNIPFRPETTPLF